MQERLESLQSIIHGHKEGRRVFRLQTPGLSPLHPSARAVMPCKALRVDGTAHEAQVLRRDAVIALEVPHNQVAVDHDQRPVQAQILPAL